MVRLQGSKLRIQQNCDSVQVMNRLEVEEETELQDNLCVGQQATEPKADQKTRMVRIASVAVCN